MVCVDHELGHSLAQRFDILIRIVHRQCCQTNLFYCCETVHVALGIYTFIHSNTFLYRSTHSLTTHTHTHPIRSSPSSDEWLQRNSLRFQFVRVLMEFNKSYNFDCLVATTE